MDLEEKYKEETGFDVGKIHNTGTTYYSDDYVKWLEKAIDYTHCCETLKDKYTHTFEVDLKKAERKSCEYIEQIHAKPTRLFMYNPKTDEYIELKP
jgi:myo-inositol catabolism protein IolC